MLKGISPMISPELLKVLAEMGHADEIVIGDCNFAAASLNKRCIRCDGHSAVELLDAILQLFPLDSKFGVPVALIQPTPGTFPGDPPIWEDFRQTVNKHDPEATFEYVERFDFYDRTRKAYATIQTGDRAAYGCILLKKGVL